ncbi:MAG: hypothetical protein KTR24_02220 [Saprospiraceae bacterium]|nr:hypothetical protein [Saprospiraceae bacterium]
MSFFSKIFSSREDAVPQPSIRFGRYTDVYKAEAKYDRWDEAIAYFEQEEFLDSYRAFFDYLRDEKEDNVKVSEKDDQIEFLFYQGSKEIRGYANAKKLKAESKIARTHELNIGFLRRLVENNYNLKYGRYCIDDEGDISIVFDTLSLDASPYKIYYALKEIALAADKQDDLLVEEFEVLEQVNSAHITPLDQEEREIKSSYLKSEIEKTLHEVEHGKLSASQYPGGITYLLLELIYRLDFFVRPEGATMESFERMHRLYFAADKASAREKNSKLIKEFRDIAARPDAKIREELYDTVSTFGITNPSTHARLKEFIQGELGTMDWYQENNYEAVALAIPGYIVGYSLFYYSLAKPDRDLLQLYLQIMHQGFFHRLGFQFTYTKEGTLVKDEIEDAIESIIKRHREVYPQLDPTLKELRYTNKAAFAKSFLQMVANLDLTKAR